MDNKTLKVIDIGSNYIGLYTDLVRMFAFCSKITNDTVQQQSQFSQCREVMSHRLFENNPTIHTDRLRYIARRTSINNRASATQWQFDKEFKTGLRIINIMEDRHGWPLTKMYDVDPIVRNLNYNGRPLKSLTFRKVLIGSSRWAISPHMVSLNLLLFRLPGTTPRIFRDIKNYEDIVAAYNRCRRARSTTSDAYIVGVTFKFWDMIMANLNKLFAGKVGKIIFDKTSYGSYFDEGISKLCTFKCSNRRINKKFAALAKKEGLE